ncbi:MAG: hypothetical protein JO073_16090 [Actinobacteria bacterium]|nr:hypothetical protein [Actinomycetota bacterium]
MDEEFLELDELGAEWRRALVDAEDALASADGLPQSSHLPAAEQQARRRHVVNERVETAHALDDLAHEERVPLVHHVNAPRPTRATLGLPKEVELCVFDVEAIFAGAEELQEEAWAEVLDPFLFALAESTAQDIGQYRPFGQGDYRAHLHGKPRLVGLHDFLGSRGIRVPEETAAELAQAKSDALDRLLERRRPSPLGGTYSYLEALRETGLRGAVVSESVHARELLRHAGIDLPVHVDLDGFDPATTAVFAATAERVVQAAGYAAVIGVDAVDDRATLRAAGARRVVSALADLY